LNKVNEDLHNYSYIIIIPESEYSGCITKVEDFYNRNKENKNIFFIFKDILSIKLKVGKDVIEKGNVYFDKSNTFLSNDYNGNVYPLIFNTKDNINYHFSILMRNYFSRLLYRQIQK